MKSTLTVGLVSIALASTMLAKSPFRVGGMFAESCACSIPCKCELTGEVPSMCQGVGAYKFTSGDYAGESLAGVSLAYAVKPGEWIRIYIDAPDKAKREAAEKFARAYYAGWGKMESVKDAKVAFAGSDGNYTVSVDDGKIMTYSIEPLLGGDKKTPLMHGNTHSGLSSTFMQAKAAKEVVFHDGDRSFELPAGRNGYFNEKFDSKGEI
jgi:hypothetical protein